MPNHSKVDTLTCWLPVGHFKSTAEKFNYIIKSFPESPINNRTEQEKQERGPSTQLAREIKLPATASDNLDKVQGLNRYLSCCVFCGSDKGGKLTNHDVLATACLWNCLGAAVRRWLDGWARLVCLRMFGLFGAWWKHPPFAVVAFQWGWLTSLNRPEAPR